uniref:Cation efflux protein transmembrane domain-containing protein n=1 Tax=Aegilops tauschii subsp. strangulata TaxID=200361 RepID=A0A453Q846_AEGTS
GTAGSPPARCAASRSCSPSTPPTPPWSWPWASSRGAWASSPTPSTSPSAAACSPSPSSPWPPPGPSQTPHTPTGTRDWRSSPPSPMPQLFLLFMSFSLAVEALHSFMQDESEHKHYLIVSAVTNLLVNLLGVWFFRSYARVNIVYRKAEDMNHHSICLHVLADSVRRLDTSFLVSFIGD